MHSRLNPELEKMVKETTTEAMQKLPEGHHAQTILLNTLQALLIEGRDKTEVGHLMGLVEKIRKELKGVTKPDEIELGILGEMGLAAFKEVKRLHV
jgi:hypothetical protein